jgi:hypothetical protein
MSKLAFVIATAAFTAATSAASAGGFGWGCRTCGYSNGTDLTGIADPTSSDRYEWLGGCDDWGCGSNGLGRNGLQLDGHAVDAGETSVGAIILPSGEVLDLSKTKNHSSSRRRT